MARTVHRARLTMPRATILAVTLVLSALHAGDALGSGKAAATPLEPLLAALNITPVPDHTPPPLTLVRLSDSKPLALAALRGRPVILYFWATW